MPVGVRIRPRAFAAASSFPAGALSPYAARLFRILMPADLPTRALGRVGRVCLGWCALVVLGIAPAARAQAPADAPTLHAAPTATLEGWVDRLEIMHRDRRHGYGGLFYDRGVLRRFTRTMDHEYALDLRTFGFSLSEDAEWYGSQHGFRSYSGSIDRSHFATSSHFRSHLPLGARHGLTVSGVQQEDLAAERFYVEVGYRYDAGRHRFGFRQTLGSYKPDLDFELFYSVSGRAAGQLSIEMTLLDAANNFIVDVLGVGVGYTERDTVRTYRRSPRVLAMEWRSPTWHGLRAELHGGVQPWAQADVRSSRTQAHHFTWSDRLQYLGLLLEAQLPYVTLGATYRETGSGMRRGVTPGSTSASDFATAQTSRALHLYGLARLGRLTAEVWAGRERFHDRQSGTNFDQATLPVAMDYRERYSMLGAEVGYRAPGRGLRTSLRYMAEKREYNDDVEIINRYLRPQRSAPQSRLVAQVGYAFSRQTYLVAGTSFDLDGDTFTGRGYSVYDGGFGRLVILR